MKVGLNQGYKLQRVKYLQIKVYAPLFNCCSCGRVKTVEDVRAVLNGLLIVLECENAGDFQTTLEARGLILLDLQLNCAKPAEQSKLVLGFTLALATLC